jgi:hypothetical protein
MTKEEIKLSERYGCIWTVNYNKDKEKWELDSRPYEYCSNREDCEWIFFKPTRSLAINERDRRNRIIEYKKSNKPITKEQFIDLRNGDVYYYKDGLGGILSKRFCNSKGFNGPTDEAMISGKYGSIYWNENDVNLNPKKSSKTQDRNIFYEEAFCATPEELGKAAMLITLSAQKVSRSNAIECCDFLKEELKKHLLEIAIDIDVDSDKIEDIRGLIFSLDDIKETLTKN